LGFFLISLGIPKLLSKRARLSPSSPDKLGVLLRIALSRQATHSH
jgi:hypothetical protein